VHDGFYLRAALGVGVAVSQTSYTTKSTTGTDAAYQQDVSATATTTDVDIGLGGAVKPGFNLGAAVSISKPVNTSGTIDKQKSSDTRSQKIELGTQVFIGPMLDWYTRSQGGFHVLVSIGGAFTAGRKISVTDTSTGEDWSKSYGPYGLGMIGGLGYEWWVSDQWSIGLLGRFTALSGGDSKDSNATHIWGGASVMANITFN